MALGVNQCSHFFCLPDTRLMLNRRRNHFRRLHNDKYLRFDGQKATQTTVSYPNQSFETPEHPFQRQDVGVFALQRE